MLQERGENVLKCKEKTFWSDTHVAQSDIGRRKEEKRGKEAFS